MIHRLIQDLIKEDLPTAPQNFNHICIFADDADLDTGSRTDIDYRLDWFSPESDCDVAKKQESGVNGRLVIM
jgi:hypothetical protein